MSFPNSNSTPLLAKVNQNEGLCSLQLLEPDKQPHFGDAQFSKRDKRTYGMPPVNNFIQKTYALLQEKKFQSIVSWANNSEISPPFRAARYQEDTQHFGNKSCSNKVCSFRIHNVKAFEQLVLPQYFKHSNLSSFVRQLNMYNFHKVRGDKNQYEFQHQKFSRFRPELLCEIKRKQVQSTANIPSICLISNPELQAPLGQNIKETVQTQKAQIASISSPYISEQKIPISLQQIYESPDKKENSLKASSNDPQQLSIKLAQLQQQNRNFKKLKQSKLILLKQLTCTNKNNMINKFNKIIMSAITSKIKQDLPELPAQRKDNESKSMGMNELIEHIMDESAAKSFLQYQTSTDELFKTENNSKNEEIMPDR